MLCSPGVLLSHSACARKAEAFADVARLRMHHGDQRHGTCGLRWFADERNSGRLVQFSSHSYRAGFQHNRSADRQAGRDTVRMTQTIFFALLLNWLPCLAEAQALATATGPGSFIAAGAGVSGFETDYGHNRIGGGFAFVDANPTWRIGLEGEVRLLRWHAQQDVTESTYLGGLRVVVWPTPRRWQPYVKCLVGGGRITLPYGYAHGSFMTYAPGAGLDVVLNDRFFVRAIDFEAQRWPQFSYGALQPYGLSAGISMRLNGISRFPKGKRARH